jgi:Cu-Zn family superoxide dismutase
MRRFLLLALPLAALAGCETLDEGLGDVPTGRVGQATIRLANGLPGGTAQLLDSGSQLTLSVAVAGMTQGTHGIHLHMVGKCDAPEFTTAGGHLNPGMKQHGTENPAGAHLGDLPNLIVGASGTGTVTTALRGSREEVLAEIFDPDGTAVVVHANPDDYKTDPSGNSGRRIACGVITRV